MPLIGSATGFGSPDTLVFMVAFAKTFLGGPANDITDVLAGDATGTDGDTTGVAGASTDIGGDATGDTIGGAVTVCVCPFTVGCCTVGPKEGK
jgi:hypothetical protein